jgi:hypothetical protein
MFELGFLLLTMECPGYFIVYEIAKSRDRLCLRIS